MGDSSGVGSRNVEVYEKVEQVGEGTYGQLYKARHKDTGEIVALKRVRMDNEKEGFPVTAIREIKILKVLNHKNVVQLKEIVTSKASEYNQGKGSIYMVMEFSDHDLTGLTDAGTRFTTPQVKCYMKQLLEGLAYCHKNRVLHRDIKGSNLLINNEGYLKLADFGLARPFDDSGRQLTNRVITLWYRPPELLLGATNYGPSVDMWSVGCIFAELLTRKPILPGRNEFEQIDLIFRLIGTPTEQTWPGLTKLHYYNMVATQSQQAYGNKPHPNKFQERFGTLDKRAQQLLQALLQMDPSKRISAKEALDHDYFWEAPFPAKPEELPRYPQSHEFTAKKRRQDASKGPNAAPPPQQQQQQQQQALPVSNGYPPYANGGGQPRNNGPPPPYGSSQYAPPNKRPREGEYHSHGSYPHHNGGGPPPYATGQQQLPPQRGYGHGPPPYHPKSMPSSGSGFAGQSNGGWPR